MKILIGYDGSTGAESSFDCLGGIGLPQAVEAHVLCVADVWIPLDQPTPSQEPPMPAAVAAARAEAGRELDHARNVAAEAATRLQRYFPEWKVTSSAVADSPSWGILEASRTLRSDLIVLGSHGRSTLQRIFLGSVALKVASEASCSVRIHRSSTRRLGAVPRMIVAVDGSAESQAAVQAVAARQWPNGSEAILISVIDPRMKSAVVWPAVYASEWAQEKDCESTEWIGRLLENSAATLRLAGLQVDTHIFEGDPKHVLLRESEQMDVDSIFLGARGLQHGNRLFLGSLASAVAGRAHCPVEIVRSLPS